MKRCSRCILPETVPVISFDANGVCNFCRSYRKERYFEKKELDRIIESARREDNKYDCIVPLSGGRDSMYVLYVAKAIYKLKVLAVSYDNEFRVEQALVNMQRACNKLSVDFLSIRSKRNIAKKCVKYAIRSAVQFGRFGVCNACEYGYRSVVYRAAEEYGAPLIFWGESQLEKTTDMNIKQTGEQYNLIKYLKLLKPNYYLYEYYFLLQRLEFRVFGNNPLLKGNPILTNKNIKEIRLFDYIPWDRKKIKDIIMGELGWEKPHDHASTWRTDCEIHSFVNYYHVKLFGCTKDCFGYCKMINSGQLNREQALKQEEETIINIEKSLGELLGNKIGLSLNEIERIESFQKWDSRLTGYK